MAESRTAQILHSGSQPMNEGARLNLNDWDKRLRKYTDRVGLCVVAAVVLLEVAVLYFGLGYSDFYDEGVYLQSARMMVRGCHLYKTIFDSQPPLWLPLIYGSFRLGGLNLSAAQSSIGLMALVTTLAAALATRQLAGWGAAGLAAGAVFFSPMEIWFTRVSPEIPAIALGTAAMAFAIRYMRRGSHITLGLAAILVTCSILVKLLGLFTVPAMMLMVGARQWNLDGVSWPQKGKLFLKESLFVLAIATIIISACMFKFGATNVWRQAVQFHWSARTVSWVDSLTHRSNSVAAVILSDGLPALLALFAILSIYAGPVGIALIGWILFTIFGLLSQQPLYEHHMVVLIPPIAIAGAIGWEYIPRLAERLRMRWNGTPKVELANGLTLLLDVTLVLLLISAFAVRIADTITNPIPLYRSDIAAAQMIRQMTNPNETILTDAPGIAFLADRDVPPELADTSFLRIATGYLTLGEVVAYSDRRDVRLVLLWSGRLASMSGMKQWLGGRFPYHRTLGDHRELYTMEPESLAATADMTGPLPLKRE
jgi:hypothetical protein